jgi:predicted RNA-binding Zn-ribbon protein involved in translation (DUF1610 family)
MFKCDNCGEEYETRESFAMSQADGEEFMVFDGERMRDICPKCGGLICSLDEVCQDVNQKVA